MPRVPRSKTSRAAVEDPPVDAPDVETDAAAVSAAGAASPDRVARPVRRSMIRRLFQPQILLLSAVVVALIVCGPYLKARLPSLADQPEYLVRTADIRIENRPEWAPANIVSQVIDQSRLAPEMSLLDAGTAQLVAEAFAKHPWVKSVERVTLSRPAAITVQATFRRPVAAVSVQGGLYAIDADAVLLPSRDFAMSQARALPQITGVRTSPKGTAGQEWGDPAVLGAARLAALLGSEWTRLDLAGIVVPSDPGLDAGSGIYVLTSRGGSRILWGREPDSDRPGELPRDKKLNRLKRYVSDFGSLDKPNGPYELDIRHFREIIRRPLTAGFDLEPTLPRR